MGISIKTVAVLGANGQMGSLSGCLFAQAELEVFYLSRSVEKSKRGIETAVQQVRSQEIAHYMTPLNYDRMEEAISRADWIFEAVSENFDLKREFYERIDAIRKPNSIVSTVSSGLSIEKLAEGRSDDFRKHFLGTHFYNPPTKLPAAERIAHRDTDPEVIQFVDRFMEKALRRVVIPTHDTPAFAGNRIGFQLLNEAATLAEEIGIAQIDYLLGPYTGRAMPPLAIIDLVGLDVHKAIVDNIYENTQDERHETFRLPNYVSKMIQLGQLGNKTPGKGGFYKEGAGGERLVLDPETEDYLPVEKVELGFVEAAKKHLHVGEYPQAFQILREARCEEADLVRKVMAGYVSYAFSRVGEVTPASDGMKGIDAVMAYGFSWAPPSAIVDAMGGPEIALEWIDRYRFARPPYLEEQVKQGGARKLYSDPNVGRYFIAA